MRYSDKGRSGICKAFIVPLPAPRVGWGST